MRGYIEWLRDKAEGLPESLRRQFEIYREESVKSNRHARLASDVAMLRIGYDHFVDYGVSLSVIDADVALNLKADAGRLFMELANEQNHRVCAEKPSEKFITALRELLATKQCTIQSLGTPLYDNPSKQ